MGVHVHSHPGISSTFRGPRDSINQENILKTLADTPWGQQKETQLITYNKAVRQISSTTLHLFGVQTYTTPICTNEALRIATGCHKMSSIDHLHTKLLGVYLDTFFSFNAHCIQVALVGANWGQQKETLLLTYKALARSIENYVAPVWSTNASENRLEKIQRTQNEALRIITGSHKMSPIQYCFTYTQTTSHFTTELRSLSMQMIYVSTPH